MKTMRKALTFCLATSLMATSLNAFATTKSSELMKMGPNQLIGEGQKILWNSAYRVDKELIGESETHISLERSAYSSSSGGGTNLGRTFSGSVLGGLIGGVIGGPWAAAGGAVLAGGLTLSNKTVSSSSDETHFHEDSKSETYQVHEKANTWVIVGMDKDSYLAAHDELAKSKVLQNNACAQQGMTFLDSVVKDYRVASASDLENLSTIVQQLNDRKDALNAEADKSNTVNPLSEKIDEFNAQRVRVVRLNWRSILLRQGSCKAGQDLQQNLESEANNLFNDLKKTSVIANANSMALISNVTFSKLPDVGTARWSQFEAQTLQASQARMLVYQAQVLKALEDGNYINLKNGRILQTKNMVKLEAALNKKDDIASNGKLKGYAMPLGAVAVTAFGMSSVGAVKDIATFGGRSLAIGGIAVSGSGYVALSADLFSLNQKMSDKTKDAVKAGLNNAAEIVAQDANFNKILDQTILANEQIYNLGSDKVYLAERNNLIASYKANAANLLVHQKDISRTGLSGDTYEQQLKDQEQTQRATDLTNYPYFLNQSRILSADQINQMRNVFEVMKGNSISAEYSPLTLIQEQQMKDLSSLVAEMANQEKNLEQKSKLMTLAVNLNKEAKVLSLLK